MQEISGPSSRTLKNIKKYSTIIYSKIYIATVWRKRYYSEEKGDAIPPCIVGKSYQIKFLIIDERFRGFASGTIESKEYLGMNYSHAYKGSLCCAPLAAGCFVHANLLNERSCISIFLPFIKHDISILVTISVCSE